MPDLDEQSHDLRAEIKALHHALYGFAFVAILAVSAVVIAATGVH